MISFLKRNTLSVVCIIFICLTLWAMIAQIGNAPSTPTVPGTTQSTDHIFWIIVLVFIGLSVLSVLGKGGGASKLALWVVVASLLIFGGKSADVWQKTQNSAAQAVLDDSQKPELPTASSNQAPRQRVIAEDFVLPAGGTIVVQKKMRCHVDNISDELMSNITRESAGGVVKYTSTDTDQIVAQIWFFDEGGDCKSDYVKLSLERAFI